VRVRLFGRLYDAMMMVLRCGASGLPNAQAMRLKLKFLLALQEFCAGCVSSHRSTMECARNVAYSRVPVMTFPAISTPPGWIATDHCPGSTRTRMVYRMFLYSIG
jgi:hypothetical protein